MAPSVDMSFGIISQIVVLIMAVAAIIYGVKVVVRLKNKTSRLEKEVRDLKIIIQHKDNE